VGHAALRRQGGEATWTRDDGRVVERATFTCRHCQRLVFVPPKADPASLGGFCGLCQSLICGPCADAGSCTPFEERLEQQERQQERDRMYRQVLGLNDFGGRRPRG